MAPPAPPTGPATNALDGEDTATSVGSNTLAALPGVLRESQAQAPDLLEDTPAAETSARILPQSGSIASKAKPQMRTDGGVEEVATINIAPEVAVASESTVPVTDNVEDTTSPEDISRDGSTTPPDVRMGSETSSVESEEDAAERIPSQSATSAGPAFQTAGYGIPTPASVPPTSSADGSVSFYHQILAQVNTHRAHEAASLKATIAGTNAAAIKKRQADAEVARARQAAIRHEAIWGTGGVEGTKVRVRREDLKFAIAGGVQTPEQFAVEDERNRAPVRSRRREE